MRSPGFEALARRTVYGSKGALLAHLIGFSVLWQVFIELALTMELPLTRITEVPIRIVAVWLLLDRFGRAGRYRLTWWDSLYAFLVVAHGIGFIYSDLALIRFSGGGVFVDWMLVLLNPLLYFVVVREASLRRSYRPDILLYWLVGVMVACALLGLAQALNIAGLRELSATVFGWNNVDRQLQGPSAAYQARGPFAHANVLAVMMVFSLCLVPICYGTPKFKWLAAPLFIVLMSSIFSTYSRIGIVSAAGVFAVVVGFLLARKKFVYAVAGLCTAVLLTFAFIASIYIFDIQRFKIFVEGEGTVARAKAEEIGGWYLRQDANSAAVKKGLQFPIFGVGATGAGINRLDKLTQNVYSYRFLTTNSYTYAWVSHGVFGLLFVLGQIYLVISVGFSKRISPANGLAFAMLAAALAGTGAAENVNFFQAPMAFVNVVLAMYAVPALRGVRFGNRTRQRAQDPAIGETRVLEGSG